MYCIYTYIFNIVNQLYFNKIEKIKHFLLKINIYKISTGILRRRMSSAPRSPPGILLESLWAQGNCCPDLYWQWPQLESQKKSLFGPSFAPSVFHFWYSPMFLYVELIYSFSVLYSVPLYMCIYVYICIYIWTSLVAQMVKHLPTMQETWAQSLGWEDPQEKEIATHSSTLAWKIPWTEEPGRL